MALKNFKDQKFRKKDGMPYGYKPMAEEDTREAQYNMAQQVEQPTIDNTQSIAELRKARNNPGMQEYLNSEEHKRKQREYRQRALELARSKSSSNSDAKPNAGDDRTTAYKQPQTVSVGTTGLGILPTYSGMNIASNGADVDPEKYNTPAIKGTPTVSEEDSFQNAKKKVNKYLGDKELEGILNNYAKTYAAQEEATATSALGWKIYEPLKKAMFGNDLEEYKNQFMKKTGVSEDEFNDIAEHYIYYINTKATEALQDEMDEKSLGEKLALTPIASMASITGNALGIISTNNSQTKAEDIGRNYNSGSFAFKNYGNAVKESVNKDISGYYDENGNRVEGLVDEEKHPVLNKVATTLYNVPTMAGESVVTAMYPMGLGTSFYASGTYADTLREDENRGLTEEQALKHASIMGTAEYLLEKTPVAHLSEVFSKGNGNRTIKSLILRQMREEGQEEIGGDVVDVISDALISGDKSKLNQTIALYQSQEWADNYNNGIPLSKEEATKRAWKEWGLNSVNDYVMASLSAGLSVGAGASYNAGVEARVGRKIAKDTELTDSMLNNAESQEFIANTREAYNTDEDYNKALETRQKLQQAAEQAAQKKRISGKAARAITSGVREAYDNMNAKSRVVFQQQVEAAQEEAEQKTIERVEKASSASELETIKEENIRNESIVAAVEEKESQLVESGKVSEDEFAQAITPSKAREIAKSGEEIKAEDLEQLPQEVQDAYKVGYSEKVHEVTQNITNEDITKINYSEEGKSKTEAIKSVTSNRDQIIFETESGAKVPASEVRFNNKAKYLYNSENGILSLDNPALVQMAIDIEAASQNGISVANVTTPLKTMYTAGEAGISFDEAYNGLKVYSNAISKDILQNAYNEGAKLSVARTRATTNVRRGRGLIVEQSEGNEDAYKAQFRDAKGDYSEEVQRKYESEVSDTEKKFLELLSKKIGTDIRFTSDDSGNRGEYKPNEGAIYLNLNNDINMFEVALHEGIGEFLAASNEKAYNQIADSVLSAYAAMNSNKLASDIRAYQKAYANDQYGDTARGASRELFNDAIGEILSSESNLKKMFDWMVTNEGEKQAQKVKKTLVDYFHDLVDMIKSIKKLGRLTRLERNRMRLSEDQANKYADMIFKAMDEAIANRDAAVNEPQNANNSNRKSLELNELLNLDKEDRNNYQKFYSELQDYSNGKIKGKDLLVMDYTPDILQKIGLRDLPIYMSKKHYNDITHPEVSGKAKYHGLSMQEVAEAPIILNNPAIIIDSATDDSSIVVVSNSLDDKGRPIVISIKSDGTSIKVIDSNYLTSMYGRNNFANWIDAAITDGRVLFVDKAKSQEMISRLRVQFPSSFSSLSFDTIIKPSVNAVNGIQEKNKIKSQSNPHSYAVDTEGRSSKKIGDIEQEAIEHFGTTDNFRVAGYLLADGSMLDFSGAHWLEGESPEYIADWKSKNDIRQVDHEDITEVFDDDDAYYKFVDERGNIRLMPESPGVSISSTVEPTAAQYRQLKEFIREAKTNPNYNNYNFFVDVGAKNPKKLAYRNNINEDRVVNDIKKYYETGEVSQNALNDFRYSIKVDTEGRSLSDDQQAFYADEHPVFTKDGALKVYYHGSENAGFTEFNVNFADDNISLFVTDSLTVAKGYSGTSDIFDPDGEWNIEKLDRFLSFMTGGELYVEQNGDKYDITELGMIGEDDKVTSFNSLKEAQAYAVDYVNKLDIRGNNSAANYKLYVHATNPLIVDVKGNEWNEIPVDSYAKHYQGVDIVDNGGIYEVDYQDGNDLKHEVFNSREELEANFGKFYESFDAGEIYLEDLYLDENNQRIPTNTREYATFAKEQGYDSVVFNDIYDNAIYATRSEMEKSSQVVIVFNANQLKSVYNEHPTVDSDIRKSIKIDWDTHNSYEVPARTYEDTVGFFGTDEEIEAADQQDLAVKSYYANIIHSKKFAGLMFEYKDGDRTKQNFLTRSTRKGYDWQYSYGYDNEPYGHNNYKDVNDVVETYGSVWGDDMTSLYQELLEATPKEGVKVNVVREGIAEEGRKSKAVFGDASPYSETINQAEYVSKVLSTLNNQLKGTSVNTDYVMDTVKYILDKYQSTVDEHDLAMELAQFIAYMTQNDNVDYNQMMNYLMNIGDEIIQSSELKDPESERVFKELKQELSSHKISLSDTERKELTTRYGGDWKAVFGKLNSVGIKLDSKNGQKMDAGIYNEIANQFREIGGVYLDETVSPVDQIATIIDAMEAMQPTAYEWDGANQMDKALDVATTIIDRYYSMATYIKETNIAKGNEKGQKSVEKAKQAEIKRLRKRQAEWKGKLNEQFAALVEDKKKMVQEQQEFYRKQAEAEKKFRGEQRNFNRKVNMTERELEKTAKTLAKMEYQGLKDTEAKRKHKENIVRTCTRLINWMNKPTDARHVPTFLKPALTDMIKAIDFMPASMRKGEDGTISAKKWQESMRKLQQVLTGLNAQSMESMDDSDKYNLALVLNAEDIVVRMEELLNKYNGTADISRMSKEDLKTLSDIMKNISIGISKMNENFMNRRFKHVSDAAIASMDEMDKLKPISNKSNAIKSTAGEFLNLDMLDPYSFFHELGEASSSIMQEFYDGEKIGVEIIREAEDFFTALTDELGIKQKDLRQWENDKKDYTFDGKTITLTPAEIMSLYCSYNREKLDQQERPFEATHHIMSGGIKAKERKIGHMPTSPVVNRNAGVLHLTEAQVFELMNTLTAEQIAYADKVVDYMSTTLAAHGNETSNKISGFSKFNGKKYFPLKTDTNTIATNESNSETGLAGLMRLIHPSFTKSQLDKADNALVLTNFFDVVTEHITGMSNYCAYAMPLSDAMRWYNYAETERNATDMEDVYWRDTRTLKASMEKVKGKGAKNYFENFLRDVNLDPANKGGSKFVGAAARALTGLGRAKAIGLNVSVWVQQPTAIVRASNVIEGKYLAQGISKMMLNPRKATAYAQDTNYLCYWKSKGFSDYRVSMGMKEIITGHNTKLQAAQEKAGAPAGLMDDVTWASMYFAAENKIKATTDLDVNSEEYRKQVDELFSEIINQTQVIDSTLRTTQTMRSKNDFEYLANAFKKEPQKSYNMLHRAAFDAYQAETVEDKKVANRAFRKTLKAFLLTSVVNGMVVAAVQAWRDDDDENYLLKWLKKLTPYGSYEAIMSMLDDEKIEAKDILPLIRGIWGGIGTIGDNADLFASLPLISEVDSWLKGYEPSSINHLSILGEAHKTVTSLTSANATEYKVAYSLATLSDYVTGLGVSNIMRDIRGIWNQSTRATGLPRIEKSTKDVEKAEKAKETDRLTQVFDSNNLSSITAEISNTYNNAIESGKDESDSWGAVRTMLKEQYLRQIAEHPADKANLENRYSTLVSKTKHKVSGEYKYYTVEQAKKSYIDKWNESLEK